MAESSQQTAGDVRVEEVFLTTSTGDKVDLNNFLMELSLSESIYQPCMFGGAVISDAANILGKLFTGDEFITFKLKTPFLSDDPSQVIHKTFSIYSVTNRKLDNDRQQFYELQFMSIEGQKDSITRLAKKYTGGTDVIASQIFEDLKEPRIKGGDSTTSEVLLHDTPHNTNNFEFIASHWSPFKCLNFLAKNSIGQELKMPNVMFFESNKYFYFTSISSLVQEQIKSKTLYDEYSYVSTLDESKDVKQDNRTSGFTYTSPYESDQMITVSNVDFPVYYDQLDNRMSGYYGNTTFAYDFANKDLYDIRFDYTSQHAERSAQLKNLLPDTFNTFKHITQTAPHGETVKSDPLSVINFKAGASGLFGENDAFNVNQVTATAFRNTALAELSAIKYEITVPGKTDIEVGKLIRFNYPNVGEKGINPNIEELFDPQISGIYVITGIRHQVSVTREHEMILEIARDSIGDVV